MAQNTEKIDKLSLWIIGIIGCMVLVGGVLQVRSHLYIHDAIALASAGENGESIEDSFLAQSEAAEDLLDAQFEDSDNDGINDAEEQTVYGTSPYLADSDSDGIDDNIEIQDGTNPNCPEGTDCGQERTGGSGETSTEAEAAFASLNPDAEVLFNEDGSVNADELRQLMIDSGVPAEEVNALTDEELQQVLQATLAEQDGTTTTTTPNAADGALDYADELLSMSTDEKRQFLVQSGLSQEQVDQFSDEEIEQLVTETVNATLQEQGLADTQADTQEETEE